MPWEEHAAGTQSHRQCRQARAHTGKDRADVLLTVQVVNESHLTALILDEGLAGHVLFQVMYSFSVLST